MSIKRGGAKVQRVKVFFEDGEKTYALIDKSGSEPQIILAGMPYDLEDFAATGAVVAVNDSQTLKLLQGAGIKARPTAKQVTITISVTQEFRDRMTKATQKTGRKTTSILVESGEQWLKEHGF